jgi:nitrogen fixation NifU-like protein
MSNTGYSDKTFEHFMAPRNVGEITNAHAKGESGDSECGDYMVIYLFVKDNIIKEITFQISGCVAAIATGSITTELAKNKTIQEAMKITEQDVVDALDGLPESKVHCSLISVAALRNAINNYQNETFSGSDQFFATEN